MQPAPRIRAIAPDHELDDHRARFRAWLRAAAIPHYAAWEQAGRVPRQIWEAAGAQGFLCPALGTRAGGSGRAFRFSQVIIEELASACLSAPLFHAHSDVTARCIERHGTPEQHARWLPGMAQGRLIGANATTEPGAGSDLQGIRTTARRERSGWVINGTKTLISHGSICDLVLVFARTGADPTPAMGAYSMFVVEATAAGFRRGEPVKKFAMRALDNVELTFEDCWVPEHALLGRVGAGMAMAILQTTDDRLVIGIECVASARRALELAVEHAHRRHVQGKPLLALQDIRFKLAELSADVEAGHALMEATIARYTTGTLLPTDAALFKYWASEMLARVADVALGIHGGVGCTEDQPISRLYADARIRRIYGGTSEIMKELISRRHTHPGTPAR